MSAPRSSPVGDFDRWAVVQAVAARHSQVTHRRILVATRDAEDQMLAEPFDAFEGLSRAGWRAELADRAAKTLEMIG